MEMQPSITDIVYSFDTHSINTLIDFFYVNYKIHCYIPGFCYSELKEGVPVYDKEGNVVTQSKVSQKCFQ